MNVRARVGPPAPAATRQPRRAASRSASTPIRTGSTAPTPITALVDAHGGEDRTTSSRPRRSTTSDQRPHPRDPQLRQGELPRAVGRPREDPGLHPPGRAAGARLRDLQAARFRRLGRRRRDVCSGPRPTSSRSGRRALHFLAKCLLPLPEKWHGLQRRRDPLPPALPRSDRQPRLAPGVRDAQPGRSRRSASS